MTFLFVMPKGIWVKESLGTEGTCQPHPQIVPVHMSAYGSLGGGQSLTAPLNLTFVNPFHAPQFKQRGIMWMVMATSKAWEMAREGASCAITSPSAAGPEGLGSTSLGS